MSGIDATTAPARDTAAFAAPLLDWYDHHGRKDLPWQQARDAYRVWLSEVMLQQTQVRTVIAYFERFVAALPDLLSLARAPQDQVLALWSGLGYYSRARNLHLTAQRCIEFHDGALPRDIEVLSALPGIGRSTAAAILAQTWGDRHAILDGNVRRVLARWHGVSGWPGSAMSQRRLWSYAEMHTPVHRVGDYTQAIMDLGATLCTRSRPQCGRCPVAAGCVALRDGLTGVLPEAKPRRAIPTRATTMLIVRDRNGRILLERRPPTGVWARLWSLPEIDDEALAAAQLRERFAVEAPIASRLGDFTHTFSHYHLRVTPLLMEGAVPETAIADDPDRGWYAHAELGALGLPAPVRKLLAVLNEDDLWRAPSTA